MTQPKLEELSRLLGLLYDGHIDADPYNGFLAETRRLIGSNFGSITMREPQGDDGGLLFVSSDVLQKTFVDDHNNPYTDRHYTSNLMTNLPWGQVVCLDECIEDEARELEDENQLDDEYLQEGESGQYEENGIVFEDEDDLMVNTNRISTLRVDDDSSDSEDE